MNKIKSAREFNMDNVNVVSFSNNASGQGENKLLPKNDRSYEVCICQQKHYIWMFDRNHIYYPKII